MTTALLVTGSRLFGNAQSLGSGEWCKRQIRAALLAFNHRGIVIHGGAEGADTLAGEVALSLGWDTLVFTAGSQRTGEPGRLLANGAPVVADEPWCGPLDRNTAMVKKAAALAKGGALVRYLALAHYLSRSGGTFDAQRKAKKAGLEPAVEGGIVRWKGEGTP